MWVPDTQICVEAGFYTFFASCQAVHLRGIGDRQGHEVWQTDTSRFGYTWTRGGVEEERKPRHDAE